MGLQTAKTHSSEQKMQKRQAKPTVNAVVAESCKYTAKTDGYTLTNVYGYLSCIMQSSTWHCVEMQNVQNAQDTLQVMGSLNSTVEEGVVQA